MSRFTRHWRCARGHRMTTEGQPLYECQVFVGPARKREQCKASLWEDGSKVRTLRVKRGDRGISDTPPQPSDG